MICLICMPSALGPVALGLWAYISGKSFMPMLQLPMLQLLLRSQESLKYVIAVEYY